MISKTIWIILQKKRVDLSDSGIVIEKVRPRPLEEHNIF